MNYRRIMGLFGGAVTGVLPVGTQIVRAQQNSGGTIAIGGSIADTVSGAVSGIATNSGGAVTGGARVEHNELSLGEQEGLAISDASGGNNNVAFES